MILKAVKSSNIDKIGYDKESKKLRVQFKGNGKIFEYEDVPNRTYTSLLKSKSIGSFFSSKIKNNFTHTLDPVDDKPKKKSIKKKSKKIPKYSGGRW